MPLHRTVIINIIFTTYAIAFISAEVHKGYSHAAIHNKHGGKFAYKIHHVYHPKKHGHGGGGGGGSHGHKYEGVLYHKQHNNVFDDDFEEGSRNYHFDDFQKAEGNNEFDYKSAFPSLEDVYNQYSANEFNQLFKTEPATFNNIDDNFESSDDFGKNRNLGYSKSFGYSFAYPKSLPN